MFKIIEGIKKELNDNKIAAFVKLTPK